MANSIQLIESCPCCESLDIQSQPAVLSPFLALRALGVAPFEIEEGMFDDLDPGTSYFPSRTIFCTSCRSVSSGTRLGQPAVQRYYDGYQGTDFLAQRMLVEPSFRKRMANRKHKDILRRRGETISYTQVVEAYFGSLLPEIPTRMLDYGGGEGLNTPFAQQTRVEIFDLDAQMSSSNIEGQRWPLISLLNVLEHAMEPVHMLAQAASMLEGSGSRVLIEVPLERFMADCMSSSAFWKAKLIWTEHVNCFSPLGLEQCLDRAGMELLAPVRVQAVSDDSTLGGEDYAIMLAVARLKHVPG